MADCGEFHPRGSGCANLFQARPWGLLFFALLAFSLAAGVWGCGKKAWPEPRLEEDRFGWEQIWHERHGSCLDVRALLSGAASKLSHVILEWEAVSGPEAAQDRPFTPETKLRLDDFSREFKRQNEVIRIHVCGLDPGASYRWRLVGVNRHAGLGRVPSEIQITP